jgi:putative Holliday junction resolvase
VTRNYLCIDLGAKRIGLAKGSLETRLAAPLQTINHVSRNSDIQAVINLIALHEITNIVIGISYQMDGSPNSMGKHSLSFGEGLKQAIDLPIVYWDESLSTYDAKLLRLETGASRKARSGHQDSLAAALILQSYFDNSVQEYTNG